MKRLLLAAFVVTACPAWADEIEPPPSLPFHLSAQERSVLSAERNELSGAYLALSQKTAVRDALCKGAETAGSCRAQTDSLAAQKQRYDAAVDAYAGRVRDTRNARPGYGAWVPLEP